MAQRFSQAGRIFIFVMSVLFVLCAYRPDLAHASSISRVDIPSSPNPVGSGARALGMGGAFMAIADDATAASWNPGGLVQLENPEISMVGAYIYRTEDLTFSVTPEASGSHSVSTENINYFSITYPFTLGDRNMIVSLNYQHLYDFTRNVDYYILPESSGLFQLDSKNHIQMEGRLYAIGLAYAIQMTPAFSFGFTLNFWEDWLGDNGWEKTNHETNSGGWSPTATPPYVPMYSDYTRFDRYSFSGFNANLGFMWQINAKMTVGAVVKTPFTADLVHENTTRELTYIETIPRTILEDGTPKYATRDEELTMPMSYGIGAAYRFSDKFTVSADIYRTQWQDFVLKDYQGNETSPISGLPLAQSDIDPTTQVRAGAEYLLIKPKYVIPLRCGVFYDPAPAEGSPDDFYGFSLGSGIAYKRLIFDAAYQYRFGRGVGASVLQNLGFSQDVDEHTLYFSLIIHF